MAIRKFLSFLLLPDIAHFTSCVASVSDIDREMFRRKRLEFTFYVIIKIAFNDIQHVLDSYFSHYNLIPQNIFLYDIYNNWCNYPEESQVKHEAN